MIAAVVLAAGAGTRFGGAKVVAELSGVALVRHVVDRLLAAGITTIVVTADTHAAAVRGVLAGTPARVVETVVSGGMSASLRDAVAALPDESAAFLVALGDMPRFDPAVVRTLVETWERSTAAAVVPVYRGEVQGHPVLFDATMRRRLAMLTGDAGARGLLRDLGDRVVWLAVDADPPGDVDTPEDLARLSG